MSNQATAVSRPPESRNLRSIRRLFVAVLALAVVAGACGDDTYIDVTSNPPDAAAFPITERGTEIPALPQRIVSLSATHTEVLYEIGAGPAIIATDLFSDYPPAAAATQKVDAFNLSVEAVATLDPDLVILSYDPGDALSGFAALGIPAILFAPPGPTTLDEVYAEWLDLGDVSGHPVEASALVAQVSREADGIVTRVPQTLRSFTYYVELDSTLFSAGPGTLLDTIFGLLGMTNVVGADAGPYPQLSAEFLLDANPDFIFLADTVCCGQDAATIAQRPGWDELSAIRNGHVVELDDSVASRWSHRILTLMISVAQAVYGAA